MNYGVHFQRPVNKWGWCLATIREDVSAFSGLTQAHWMKIAARQQLTSGCTVGVTTPWITGSDKTVTHKTQLKLLMTAPGCHINCHFMTRSKTPWVIGCVVVCIIDTVWKQAAELSKWYFTSVYFRLMN